MQPSAWAGVRLSGPTGASAAAAAAPPAGAADFVVFEARPRPRHPYCASVSRCPEGVHPTELPNCVHAHLFILFFSSGREGR